jgi:hypothetical protein
MPTIKKNGKIFNLICGCSGFATYHKVGNEVFSDDYFKFAAGQIKTDYRKRCDNCSLYPWIILPRGGKR